MNRNNLEAQLREMTENLKARRHLFWFFHTLVFRSVNCIADYKGLYQYNRMSRMREFPSKDLGGYISTPKGIEFSPQKHRYAYWSKYDDVVYVSIGCCNGLITVTGFNRQR